MAVNYVKFVRGTPSAFKNAVKNKDTLYFIAENGQSEGELYLGDKLLSGGDISLGELTDVIFNNLKDNELLVYDASSKAWVNKSVIEAISIMQGPTDISQGSAGLVPPPGIKQQNYFLKGDGTWGLPEVTKDTIDQLTVQIANSVYSKEEIDNLFKTNQFIQFKQIASLSEINLTDEKAGQYIYILLTDDGHGESKYETYIVLNGKAELIGASRIELEDYVTHQFLSESFESYTKDVVDKKVAKKSSLYEGEEVEWTLLSPENQKKLANLVTNGEHVEISGKVNADNVEGLATWIEEKRNNVGGLLSEAQAEKLQGIEDGAQKNTILTVDSTQFYLNENKHLTITNIPAETIKNLKTVLPVTLFSEEFKVLESGQEKVLSLSQSYISKSVFDETVGNLGDLKRQVRENSSLVEEVNFINERLKWQNLN